MSVLIKGLQFPKDNAIAVVIHPDGTAYSSKMFAGVCTEYLTDCSAVPVPTPHGKLIDADVLYEDCALDHDYDVMATTTRINEYMQLKIDNAPTIIPAEEGET